MHSKGNHKQEEKIALRTEENNCKWSNWRRINIKYTSSSYNSIPEKQTTQSKSEKRPTQTFLPYTDISAKKTYRWLTNTWKDAQHCSLEKCKLKPQWDITSYQSEWPSSKSLQTINTGEDVAEKECSCTVGGNINWYSHYGRWYGDYLQN